MLKLLKLKEFKSEYARLLSLPQWSTKRKAILKRDKFRCRCCGNGASLQVHHRQYHKNKNTSDYKAPWEYEDKLLITLCNRCHNKGHQIYSIPVFIIN